MHHVEISLFGFLEILFLTSRQGIVFLIFQRQIDFSKHASLVSGHRSAQRLAGSGQDVDLGPLILLGDWRQPGGMNARTGSPVTVVVT